MASDEKSGLRTIVGWDFFTGGLTGQRRDKPRRYEKIVGQELRNKEWVGGKEP